MSSFLLRVDDVGQAVDQSQPDHGLEGFRRWWDAGGWDGLPVYLGVVPKALADAGIVQLELSKGPIELCLHGWDHADQILSREHVKKASLVFPAARCVIPPYNKYDAETINAVRFYIAGKPVLFGGFDGEHHNHGPAPRIVNGVLHLSAERTLYNYSHAVATNLREGLHPHVDYPLVITLHWRWDAGCKDAGTMDRVRRLRDLVADRLVTVDEAWAWARENP